MGDGSHFGARITYIDQKAPRGLAHAVLISEPFLRGEPFVMYLGDNLIADGITALVDDYRRIGCNSQILLARHNSRGGRRRSSQQNPAPAACSFPGASPAARSPRHSAPPPAAAPAGKEVLAVPTGTAALSATVALARGVHAITYERTLPAAGHPALFRWASMHDASADSSTAAPSDWQPALARELTPGLVEPAGLFGTVRLASRPEQRRIDGAIAMCCLSDQVGSGGGAYEAAWTGTLTAPATGHLIGLYAEGMAELRLDGRPVLRANGTESVGWEAIAWLTSGPHVVVLTFHVFAGSGGIEWTWTPPGRMVSIVPPLSPPLGALISPAVPESPLGSPELQPTQSPLQTVP